MLRFCGGDRLRARESLFLELDLALERAEVLALLALVVEGLALRPRGLESSAQVGRAAVVLDQLWRFGHGCLAPLRVVP